MITKFELYEGLFSAKPKVYDEDIKNLINLIRADFNIDNLTINHKYSLENGKLKKPKEFDWTYNYNGKQIHLKYDDEYGIQWFRIMNNWIDKKDFSEKLVINGLVKFFIEKEKGIQEDKLKSKAEKDREEEIRKTKDLFHEVSISGVKKEAEKYNL